MTSPTNPGFTRTWSTFSAGVDEVIDARVWTGFHFRSSDVAGARLGRQVGRFVFEHALRAAKSNKKGSDAKKGGGLLQRHNRCSDALGERVTGYVVNRPRRRSQCALANS